MTDVLDLSSSSKRQIRGPQRDLWIDRCQSAIKGKEHKEKSFKTVNLPVFPGAPVLCRSLADGQVPKDHAESSLLMKNFAKHNVPCAALSGFTINSKLNVVRVANS